MQQMSADSRSSFPGRVGVLLGGLSTERPISFKSGHAVADALRSRGFDVVEIDVGLDVDLRLRAEGVQTAFPVLHGKWGEDGCIQGLLECMGIPYCGPSVTAAALTMDKVTTLRLLEAGGVPIPKGITWTREQGADGPTEPPFSLPLIVKPVREGSSFGVTRVFEPAQLAAGVRAALELDDRCLIEELLEPPELTVGVLAGRALPLVEIAPVDGWFDFTAKYTKGKTEYFCPARIPEDLTRRVQEIGLLAAKLTGCLDSCRIDVMAGGARGPRVLEVNTIPGMTGTSLLPMAAKAVGIEFPELCERLLRMARLRNRT
jgi:D-alanine-D-alanine ligase